jgi:alpha-1,2-mannosyltransferase
LWCLFGLVIAIAVGLHPESRTVTPVYREAAASFAARGELYAEGRRFHYLPAFAVAFAPLARIPFPWAEVPWRLGGLALLACGVSALARMSADGRAVDLFPLMTLLAIPSALSAARSGQTNLPLAGALALAAVAFASSSDTRTALWLGLGVVLKPLAIVMALLAAVLRLRVAVRLTVVLAIVLLLPFAFADADYVLSQYRSLLTSWSSWSTTHEHRFCDLAGLLRTFHVEPPGRVMLALRAVAAATTLGLVVLTARRRPAEQALLLLGLSASYLMLFNPMTETNSYVILAPAVAALAARALLIENRRQEAWILIAIAIGLGADSYGNPVHPWTNLWWKAFLALVFYALLTRRVLRAHSS